MEVIKGKWYGNDFNSYRKCKESQNVYNGYLSYSDAIIMGSEFIDKYTTSDRLSDDKIAKWGSSDIKEVSILEIQDYLPNNHPDKGWCIKVESDGKSREVNDWRVSTGRGTYSSAGYIDNNGLWSQGPNKKHVITLDEFKKYILKEPIVESMPEVDDKATVEQYRVALVDKAECIGECVKGDIFKRNSYDTWDFIDKYSFGWYLMDDEQYKSFTSLDEARAFSNQLLGAKDFYNYDQFVKGEIYTDGDVIFQCVNKNKGLGLRISCRAITISGSNKFLLKDNRAYKASTHQIKWFKTCMKQNKFIEEDKLRNYDKNGNKLDAPSVFSSDEIKARHTELIGENSTSKILPDIKLNLKYSIPKQVKNPVKLPEIKTINY